jgi:multidrug efflux pump subunit AcrA (membrane-fusion protein)
LIGAVSFLDYHVDPTSRSVGVRITLDNTQLESWPEELPLRPGMFGRAMLETTARQAELIIPETALVHDDSGDYVFVQVEPFAFTRRDVRATLVAGGMVEITAGLKAGEAVAVTGTFLLKSAERQSELGGGHSH